MPLDEIVLGFLAKYWGVPLRLCSRPEVDLLCRIFSYGCKRQGSLAQAMPRDGSHPGTIFAASFGSGSDQGT